jgi:hypothetical protein
MNMTVRLGRDGNDSAISLTVLTDPNSMRPCCASPNGAPATTSIRTDRGQALRSFDMSADDAGDGADHDREPARLRVRIDTMFRELERVDNPQTRLCRNWWPIAGSDVKRSEFKGRLPVRAFGDSAARPEHARDGQRRRPFAARCERHDRLTAHWEI